MFLATYSKRFIRSMRVISGHGQGQIRGGLAHTADCELIANNNQKNKEAAQNQVNYYFHYLLDLIGQRGKDYVYIQMVLVADTPGGAPKY